MKAKKKILVVDDEPTILITVKKWLEREEGIRVLTAPSVEEALGCLEKEQIDLVISDLTMPRVDGIEFLMKLIEQKKEVKFAFMTSRNEELIPILEAKGLEKKVVRVFPKPSDYKAFVKEVLSLL